MKNLNEKDIKILKKILEREIHERHFLNTEEQTGGIIDIKYEKFTKDIEKIYRKL